VNAAVRRNGSEARFDYAVPIARNREMMAEYWRLEPDFRYVIFGIGDAHVHANILPSSEREFARGQQLMLDSPATPCPGTVSAEHGLGKRNAPCSSCSTPGSDSDEAGQAPPRSRMVADSTLFPL
jgi:hypothetical protein